MITLSIILVVILVICIIWGVLDEWFNPFPMILIFLSALVLMFVVLGGSKWQISGETLTGYVYSRSEAFGYATYELRFSQNAGADTQPSFCVKAGSEQDNAFKEVVGKDQKVTVVVPSSGYRFVNNPFECSSEAQLTLASGEEQEKE